MPKFRVWNITKGETSKEAMPRSYKSFRFDYMAMDFAEALVTAGALKIEDFPLTFGACYLHEPETTFTIDVAAVIKPVFIAGTTTKKPVP